MSISHLNSNPVTHMGCAIFKTKHTAMKRLTALLAIFCGTLLRPEDVKDRVNLNFERVGRVTV